MVIQNPLLVSVHKAAMFLDTKVTDGWPISLRVWLRMVGRLDNLPVLVSYLKVDTPPVPPDTTSVPR